MSRIDAPDGGGFVCMVAYSDYVFDARIRREAETLAASGFKVTCLKTKTGARSDPRRYVMNGVEVYELGIRKYQGKKTLAYFLSYCRFLLAASAFCVRLVLKRQLDVVHVHNLPDFLVFAGLLPRLAGCKVVLDIHDSLPETYAAKFSNTSMVWRALCLEETLSARLAHKVICVNHPQRDTLMARGLPASKTFVSMNVPDPSIFKSSAADHRYAATDETFDVVYHGTMAKRLGVDLIIRAVAQARKSIPNVRLHLWGRGDDLESFGALVHELGMQDRTIINRNGYALDELPQQLSAMHLGLVGNRRSVASELMLPVKLMEYASLGIPVVAPRIRTIEHYFSDDMVAYYEPEDVTSFADSIVRLCLSPDGRRRQAENAREFLKVYGWERQGAQLVTFYQELLGV
jgi:glycosyltransferase involved in cell wall biosynthesis